MCAALQKKRLPLQTAPPGSNCLCCRLPIFNSLRSQPICKITISRRTANFLVSPSFPLTTARGKIMLSPRSEPLPSACIYSLTVYSFIALHEIRGSAGASTPVPARRCNDRVLSARAQSCPRRSPPHQSVLRAKFVLAHFG